MGNASRYPSAPASHTSTAAFIVPAVFLGFVALAAGVGRIPRELLFVYLGASVLAFFAYGADKAAAVRGQWRTKETSLHALALIGGWPGALLAQKVFHHKSSKASFQAVFWITVVLNCALLAWVCATGGAELLNELHR